MNPPTSHYEFFGPPGAFLVTLLTPSIAYALFFSCNQSNNCLPNFIPERVLAALSDPNWWLSLWDTHATLIYLAWYTFCVLAWAILPGDWVQGTTLRNGDKKKYKINGATFSLHFPLNSKISPFQLSLPSFSPSVSPLASSSILAPRLSPFSTKNGSDSSPPLSSWPYFRPSIVTPLPSVPMLYLPLVETRAILSMMYVFYSTKRFFLNLTKPHPVLHRSRTQPFHRLF